MLIQKKFREIVLDHSNTFRIRRLFYTIKKNFKRQTFVYKSLLKDSKHFEYICINSRRLRVYGNFNSKNIKGTLYDHKNAFKIGNLFFMI